GMVEDLDGAHLVVIAGGAPNSRRDRFGAVVDAVTAVRKASQKVALVVCVPREAGPDAIEASLEAGAGDVLVTPPVAGALLAGVRAGLRVPQLRSSCDRYERYGDVLVHIGAQGEISLDSPEALHDVLLRITEAVGWTRAALILVGEEPNGLILVSAS